MSREYKLETMKKHPLYEKQFEKLPALCHELVAAFFIEYGDIETSAWAEKATRLFVTKSVEVLDRKIFSRNDFTTKQLNFLSDVLLSCR